MDLVVQWITHHATNARGPGLTLSWGTRSHMLQLSLSTTCSRTCSTQLEKLAKTQRNQKKRPQGILRWNHSCQDHPGDTTGQRVLKPGFRGKAEQNKGVVSARLPLALNALFQKVLDDSRGHYLVQGRWGEILPPSSLRSWPHDQHPKLMNQEEEGRPPPCKFWARLSPGGGPPIVLITWGKLGELQCPPRGWGRCHFSHHPCPYSWPLLTLRYPSNHKRIFPIPECHEALVCTISSPRHYQHLGPDRSLLWGCPVHWEMFSSILASTQ